MKLTCRAEVTSDCKGTWEANDEELTDSTRSGDTVVCDACYIVVEPFMRMNRDYVPGEVDEAVNHYRVNFNYCRNHPNPQELVEEAEQRASTARPGSPMHTSALACKAMAEIEVHRRTSDLHPDVQ